MTAPLSTKARIVNSDGTASPWLIAYLQSLGVGTVERTTYTAAQLATMSPAKVSTAICTDLDTTGLSFGDVIVGGGSDVRPVFWDLTNWRLG